MRFPRSILIVSYLSALALLSCFWPATTAADEPKVQIDWADGPITARLGDIAEIKVPAGYRFTGKEGTRKFLELTHNPPIRALAIRRPQTITQLQTYYVTSVSGACRDLANFTFREVQSASAHRYAQASERCCEALS